MFSVVKKFVGDIKLQWSQSSHCCAYFWPIGSLGNLIQIKLKHSNLNCDALAAALAQPSSLSYMPGQLPWFLLWLLI